MLLEKACVTADELETMASRELPSDQMGRGVCVCGGGSNVVSSSSLKCKKQEQ